MATAARVDERRPAEVRRDQEAGAAAEHVDPGVRQRQLPPACPSHPAPHSNDCELNLVAAARRRAGLRRF